MEHYLAIKNEIILFAFAAAWIDLEIIISEVSQISKIDI